MAVTAPSAKAQQTHQQQMDRAAVQAALRDAYPHVTKAKRALERATHVARRYATSSDESVQETAQQILTIVEHVDQAVAAFAQLGGE